MLSKELAKRLIIENRELVKGISLIKRNIPLSLNLNYVFVGLRRAGKSHIMYSIAQDLIAQGTDIRQILFFNFEDDRLGELSMSDLDTIKVSYEEMYDLKPIFFLDEVQNGTGWEKFARRLADTGYRVYITGSNAKMLSSEIATTLGGRYICQEVFPFTFSEFLKYKGIELQDGWQYLSNSNIVREFGDYFSMGGMPETIKLEQQFKRTYLNSVFSKIYFGDLISRYSINNPQAMRLLVRKLSESIKQPVSFNRLANLMSSVGGRIKSETVADYLSYLKETWIVFSIDNIENKLQEKESVKKYYFTDNGLLNLFLTDPNTSLLENIVAIQLRRCYCDELFYYKNGVEVDFVLWERQEAVQVSYSISDDETRNRELNAISSMHKRHPLQRAYIITYDDDEQTIDLNGLEVKVVKVWKWLLETV